MVVIFQPLKYVHIHNIKSVGLVVIIKGRYFLEKKMWEATVRVNGVDLSWYSFLLK